MSSEGQITPQGDSRRDLLSQQFDQVETSPAPTPEPAEAAPALEPKTDDRPRDAQGKFVAKTESSPAVEGAPVVEPVVEEPAWSKPPKSWKPEFHELYGKADPKIKEYIFQREEESNRGVVPLKEKAQFADAINKVAQPYMSRIQAAGIDVPTAVERLMNIEATLAQGSPEAKRNLIHRLVQQYNIPLGDDPIEHKPMDQNLFALQSQIQNLSGQFQTWQQQAAKQQEQAVLADINKFAETHEYYEFAKPRMIELLNNGDAATLQEAYDKATGPGTKLHDLIQRGTQAAAPNPVVVADKAAKAARAAAVSPKSSTPGAAAPTKAQDRRSMLEQQFSGLSDRL